MFELTNKIRIWLTALILIPVLLYWGFASSPNESREQNNGLSDSMDYFVDKAVIKEWDNNGHPQQKLVTTRLEHDPTTKQSQLDKPKSLIYRDNNSRVQITSDSGIVLDDNNRTDLEGNVVVNDNSDPKSATVLKTDQLSVYPKKDYAETDQAVTIESQLSRMEGVGMDIQFNDRILNLHSRVEGTHKND